MHAMSSPETTQSRIGRVAVSVLLALVVFATGWMVAFSILGPYLFVLSASRGKRWLLPRAGAAYAAATLSKLFGVLRLTGCTAFLVFEAFRSQVSWRDLSARMAILLIPFALLNLGGMVTFFSTDSGYYATLVGKHLAMGSQTSLLGRVVRGILVFLLFLSESLPFILLIPLLRFRFTSERRGERILVGKD